MALEIDRQHTALLAIDFENDIVHPEGAYKDFGFAQMVADNDVLDKTAQLLVAARGAGVMVIYASVNFRAGYPERPANCALFEGLHAANGLIEGTARQACDMGFNTIIVGDCCASVSQEAHDSSLTTALPFLSTISNL